MQHIRRAWWIAIACILAAASGCGGGASASAGEERFTDQVDREDGGSIPPDSRVLDETRQLPDGMYSAVFPSSMENTKEALTETRKLLDRAKKVFPGAFLAVNPGAPVGIAAGGYLVVLEGPYTEVPETPAAFVEWHEQKYRKTKDKAASQPERPQAPSLFSGSTS